MGACETKYQREVREQKQQLKMKIFNKVKLLENGFNESNPEHIKYIQNPEFTNIILSLPEQACTRQQLNLSSNTNKQISAKNTFRNFDGSFQVSYQEIFYPFKSDNPAITKENQIILLQQFIKRSCQNKKRIRASGKRFSLSKIFSDPTQVLISFYPYDVVVGNSSQLRYYADQMIKIEKQLEEKHSLLEHLGMIRYIDIDSNTNKHLVKIGAGVSNDQLRMWCIKKGLQIRSNVPLIQINFCGGLSTCGHGSGINSKALSDYVFQIQYINYQGKRLKLSKKQNPQLMKSASSHLGLLGIVIFVTIQLENAEIVILQPRKGSKQQIIPSPSSIKQQNIQAISSIPISKFKSSKVPKIPEKSIQSIRLDKFKASVNKTYCNWIYFPQSETVFENCWKSFGEKNSETIDQIQKKNGNFVDKYPAFMQNISNNISASISTILKRKKQQNLTGLQLLLNPFHYFTDKQTYLNYMDAVHFQRGLQNIKLKIFQMKVNIPFRCSDGKNQIDYHLIQKIWWQGLKIVDKYKSEIRTYLQMKIYSGSASTLAFQCGFDYVCSIQIVYLQQEKNLEEKWSEVCQNLFKSLQNFQDNNGQKLKVSPNWGTEWQSFPEIKEAVLSNQQFKENVQKFWQDYKQIAKIKKYSAQSNFSCFSNQLLRQIFKNQTFIQQK